MHPYTLSNNPISLNFYLVFSFQFFRQCSSPATVNQCHLTVYSPTAASRNQPTHTTLRIHRAFRIVLMEALVCRDRPAQINHIHRLVPVQVVRMDTVYQVRILNYATYPQSFQNSPNGGGPGMPGSAGSNQPHSPASFRFSVLTKDLRAL